MAKQDLAQIGEWAFIIGVIIAIIAGIAAAAVTEYSGIITLVLVILGIVIGFLNITDKETEKFLVAAIALMMTGAIATFVNIDLVTNTVGIALGTWIVTILGNVAVLVAPAAIIVALKSIKNLASGK